MLISMHHHHKISKNFVWAQPFYSCTVSRKVYVSGKSDSGQATASDLHGCGGWSSAGSDLEIIKECKL